MYVRDLRATDAQMTSEVGGKAANLGELLHAGFRVPDGFCVTTAAYDRVAREIDLDAAPGELRAAFASVALPDDLRTAVVDAYAGLGSDVAVAVRSSAIAEDLPGASFAGQQDTLLNVVGVEQLLDALRGCWASLWTDRAVAYRGNLGIAPDAVSMGVVVQRMVDAAAAGVLFTANPVTGRRAESVVDASQGLGEAVVSGQVNPDHVVVDRESGTVGYTVGSKSVRTVAVAGGGTTTVESGDAPRALSDDEARALVELGAAIERHYGAPQDIEWATDKAGTIWVVQSRPVPSLFPLPAESEAGLRVYLSLNTIQGFLRPFTPLGASVLAQAIQGLVDGVGLPKPARRRLRDASGWLYFDITEAVRSKLGRFVLPRILAAGEPRSWAALRGVIDDPRLSVVHHTPFPAMARVARLLARTRLPVRAPRVAARPTKAARRAFTGAEELQATVQRLVTDDVSRTREVVLEILTRAVPERIRAIVPTVWVGFALSRVGPAVLGDLVDDDTVQGVLASVPNNVTAEMDLALWALAEQVSADGESRAALTDCSPDELAADYRAGRLPAVFQQELGEFLARHGHHAAQEIDIATPRWHDDPAPLIASVAGFARAAGSGHSAAEHYRKQSEKAELALAGVRGGLRGRFGRFALDRARRLVGLREMPKNYLIIGLRGVREQLVRAGAALVERGELDRADDVFFLTLDEIGAATAPQGDGGAGLRELVAGRRATFDLESRRATHPRLLLSDGTDLQPPPPEVTGGAAVLTGSSASPGSATGVARVVLDPSTAELEAGEILVAPSTDPGWTPLFMVAAGLVMEVGGPNSHGATVAREYGIPAVVGVPDATTAITTGQTVAVDGSSGTVTLF
jgi:rifampicin phosphotransferase